MREYVWQSKERKARDKTVRAVMQELEIRAKFAKLGAMILKGYMA